MHVLVWVIVVTALLVLARAGYDVLTAIGAIVAAGVVTVELLRRLALRPVVAPVGWPRPGA